MENREVSALERLLREGTDDDVRRFFLLLKLIVMLISVLLALVVLREVDPEERRALLGAMSES